MIYTSEFWGEQGRVGKITNGDPTNGNSAGRYLLMYPELAMEPWWTIFIEPSPLSSNFIELYIDDEDLLEEYLVDWAVVWPPYGPDEVEIERREFGQRPLLTEADYALRPSARLRRFTRQMRLLGQAMTPGGKAKVMHEFGPTSVKHNAPPTWPVVTFDDHDLPAIYDKPSDLIHFDESEFWIEVSEDDQRWGRVVVAFDNDFYPVKFLLEEQHVPVAVRMDRKPDPSLFQKHARIALTERDPQSRFWLSASPERRAEITGWRSDEIQRELILFVRRWRER